MYREDIRIKNVNQIVVIYVRDTKRADVGVGIFCV